MPSTSTHAQPLAPSLAVNRDALQHPRMLDPLAASRRLRRLATAPLIIALAAPLIAACGGRVAPAASAPAASSPSASASPEGSSKGSSAAGGPLAAAAQVAASLRNWPEFGLNPQRSDASNALHGHHRRQRRPPAPPTDRAARDGGLLADLPSRGHRGGRRAQRRDPHHHLRQDDRDRRLQRAHPVDLHATRILALGGHRPDHDRQPDRRSRPRVRLRRLPQRADPQALAGRRQRGLERRTGQSRSRATPPTRSSRPR